MHNIKNLHQFNNQAQNVLVKKYTTEIVMLEKNSWFPQRKGQRNQVIADTDNCEMRGYEIFVILHVAF